MVRKLWQAVVPHSPYSPVAHGNTFLLKASFTVTLWPLAAVVHTRWMGGG